MQVIRSADECPRPPEGTVVTIGAYDGVHLGHQQVIAEVRQLAEARGLRTAVVTFDRHPAMVVRPDSAPLLLTDLDQKLELLAATGVDYVDVVHFDEERSRESAEDFVHEVLVDCLRARAVVVGEDFHFGHHRGGNVALLEEMGADLGFTVEGLALVGLDGVAAPEAQQVSSTAIRARLLEGDVAGAARMLGRHHEVRGVVDRGDQRGRELGFPTANVTVPGEILLPADGIYAGWFRRADGTILPTALSLGRRPTFYENADASLLECHVLDFEGDLYGETVAVQFVARLRGEQRFEAIDDLVDQMGRDCAKARELLGA
ncbi:MAG: riboflavin kinase/FMN adenylyltransferase [Acidimicrobiales bacterium]|nr:riboflavin kinase/FMN adenylyltransferase [Acidimicrobiales bacterium]